MLKLRFNDFGWYVAHLYPTKNRDTDWEAWPLNEVRRRFYLTVHPCNLFFVPLPDRQAGENPDVIGFVADRYSDRNPAPTAAAAKSGQYPTGEMSCSYHIL
jgi:hypothetical protein